MLFSMPFVYDLYQEGGENMGNKPLKPGTDNAPSGTYVEKGPRGGKVRNPRVVHIEPGRRLPPTQDKGNTWKRSK